MQLHQDGCFDRKILEVLKCHCFLPENADMAGRGQQKSRTVRGVDMPLRSVRGVFLCDPASFLDIAESMVLRGPG